MNLIGVLAGVGGTISPLAVLWKKIILQGILVGSREMFEAMNRAVEKTKLQPVIDREFPFEGARDAYEYLNSEEHFGKVVITV